MKGNAAEPFELRELDMAGPEDRELKPTSFAGCIAVGLFLVIALLVIGFFALDAFIGRQ